MSYGDEGYGETEYGFIGHHDVDVSDTTVAALDAVLANGGSTPVPTVSILAAPPQPPLAPPAKRPELAPPVHVFRILPLITRRG